MGKKNAMVILATILVVCGAVAVWGWKENSGWCHEAPEASGCINSWERTGIMVKMSYDPCSGLRKCERQVNIQCGYTQTEEYKNCRSEYEGRKLNTEALSVLVIVEMSGGLCPDNVVCGSTTLIRNDGTVTRWGERHPVVMVPDEVRQLEKLMTKENINKMRAKEFTGTCPTAYDGQEVIYKFVLDGKEEKVESCKYDIPVDNPLVKAVNMLVENFNSINVEIQ